MHGRWTEVADRVFVGRYRFFDQSIPLVVGRDAALVVDSMTTYRQADGVLEDVRALADAPVGILVNSHGHSDHVFGNRRFRPAAIWGHERCVTFVERWFEEMRANLAAAMPELAEELAAVEADPPDRTFADAVTLDVGGREVELRYLGRGHTDNDVVARVPDADVLAAGDLLENGAPPSFGDAYPLDWPATAERLVGLLGPSAVVLPGHGDPGDRAFAERQLEELRAIAALARRIEAGELDLEAAVAAAPYPAAAAREPLERALAQLRGELD